MTDSDLYLRYVIGQVDPETLATTVERHIRCNPVLAQFIVDDQFPPLTVDGPFAKSQLDAAFVAQQETLVTRGWRRLHDIPGQQLAIHDYPLPEFRQSM